jgi:hypothetical protein
LIERPLASVVDITSPCGVKFSVTVCTMPLALAGSVVIVYDG